MYSCEIRSKAVTKSFYAVLITIYSCLTIFSFATFYPGLMTYDSIRQYEQALSGQFTDRHPPLMSLLWQALNLIAAGPQSLLAFIQIAYWLSFGLASLYAWRMAGRWRSLGVFAGGLCPLLLNFSGVIWKDTLLAVCWGVYAAFLMLVAADVSARWRAWTLIALLCLQGVLIFGAAMRYNAAPAAATLAFAGAYLFHDTWSKRLISWLITTVLLVCTPILANKITHAESTKPLVQQVIFDLAGIGAQLKANLVTPGLNSPDDVAKCYSPRSWEYFAYRECLPIHDAFVERTLGKEDQLVSVWLTAIAEHPAAYATHRLWFFAEVLRFGCNRCDPYLWVDHSDQNDFGFIYFHNRFFTALEKTVSRLRSTPLARPYFWWLVCGCLSTHLFRSGKRDHVAMAIITLSGFVYVLTYLVAGIADDFRYAYWTIFAVVLIGTTSILASSKPLATLCRASFAVLPIPLASWAIDVILRANSPIDPLFEPALY